MTTRPVWAEISRQRLIDNYRLLGTLAGAADLLAIVKANAYGHGVMSCAVALAAEGASWLGVTSAEEGVAVRAACPDPRILVMGGVWEHEAAAAIEHRLTPVVWEPWHLDWLEEAATRISATASVPVHLEIDTGMARQGARIEMLPPLLARIAESKTLHLQAVMTHFHSPELLDGRATAAQLEKFVTALDTITAHGIRPKWIHAGNSATLLTEGGADLLIQLAARYKAKAMLRPGLALYGYAPRFSGGRSLRAATELQPVLSWKTRIVSLRTIDAGETAGYSATFRASRESRLALLPVGYADGLNRRLSNRGSVIVRGQLAPIAGRISMDLTIVDVTAIPEIEIGDEVVIIGEQTHERITAYDHADLAETIPYEILCNINARVPRVMMN
jgi:alanine racemase